MLICFINVESSIGVPINLYLITSKYNCTIFLHHTERRKILLHNKDKTVKTSTTILYQCSEISIEIALVAYQSGGVWGNCKTHTKQQYLAINSNRTVRKGRVGTRARSTTQCPTWRLR